MNIFKLLGGNVSAIEAAFLPGNPIVAFAVDRIWRLNSEGAQISGAVRSTNGSWVDVSADVSPRGVEWRIFRPEMDAVVEEKVGFGYAEILCQALIQRIGELTSLDEEEVCVQEDVVGRYGDQGEFIPLE